MSAKCRLDVCLFVISDEDMKVLKNVEHIKDYGEHGFFPVFGGKM